MLKKHWLANNMLGLAFSIQGIEHLSLGSTKIGAMLLVGLFFYDIFWARHTFLHTYMHMRAHIHAI